MKFKFSHFIIPTLLSSAIVSIQAQTIPTDNDMAVYIESCSLINQGITNHDEASLADASEGLGHLSVIELEDGDFNISTPDPDCIKLPLVQYNLEFCDELRKSNFEIVEREPLAVIRAIDISDVINTISRSIAPGGKATFSFSGSGEMIVAIPASEKNVLDISIKSGNDDISLTHSDLGIPFAAWEVDEASDSNCSVTVSNPSDRIVSFAIALK